MKTRRSHKPGNIYTTNCDGDVELISILKKVATVRFLNTGYVREVNIDNLVAGKCRDYTITERTYSKREYPNTVMSSNTSGDFILLWKEGKKCMVQFIATGYTREANIDNVSVGKIADPYHKSVYGIGYHGEYDKVPYWKQAIQLWRNMMKRCYSEKDTKGYNSKGVTVDERWHCFANFLTDISSLENFDLWLAGQSGNPTKYNLDKDYRVLNNKVYSRETCMFLDESFNKSYTSRTTKWLWGNGPQLRK